MSQHVECHRCGYGWDYTGNSEYYASCPKCKTSVPLVDDDETRTATADEGAAGDDGERSERVDALRDRVAELEETATQLQAAIEDMTEKVAAIERRKRRAKAGAFQVDGAASGRPDGTAETAGDDGIHVAVESDDPAGAPSGASTRGGGGGRPGTGPRSAADAGGSDSPGTRDTTVGGGSTAGDGGADAGSPASGGSAGPRDGDDRTGAPAGGPDGADPAESRSLEAGGSGVKPRVDEDGSYDYTCPECDGPVSGQPEMCIHCGTSFRWT